MNKIGKIRGKARIVNMVIVVKDMENNELIKLNIRPSFFLSFCIAVIIQLEISTVQMILISVGNIAATPYIPVDSRPRKFFNIYLSDKLLIHQPIILGINGVEKINTVFRYFMFMWSTLRVVFMGILIKKDTTQNKLRRLLNCPTKT